jgi:inosine-uridine nucleoside N-ribohydrolase
MKRKVDRRTIIIDTDPGLDDAIALLFALAASDRLDVHAITVVAGKKSSSNSSSSSNSNC